MWAHPERVNPIRLVAAAALLAPALVAAPAHATAATGCAARSDLEHRVLVKKRPVTTRDGERFGMLRFHAGVTFAEAQDAPGTGGYGPAWCLDLVVARAFAGRTPRDRGRVAYDGATVWFAGRASTGVLSAGAGSDLVGRRIEVVYVVDGRTVRARRVMRLTYPEVG
jgi:hypothetical protein